MSAAEVIRSMGADVALVGGKVKVQGLRRLPPDVAARVVEVAREHRDELARELAGASAPDPGQDATGLGWIGSSPGFGHPDHDGWWACYDLADLAKMHGMRVVMAGVRILAFYPASLEPGLIEYAEGLLDDAKPYLAKHKDRLPILTPADAVMAVKRIMAVHRGLGFSRAEDESLWPLYPKGLTANQIQTVQLLWLVAGEALDVDAFEDAESCPLSSPPPPGQRSPAGSG